MRTVLIWPHDTKLCWDQWNKDTGNNLILHFPFTNEPFKKVWEEIVSEDNYSYKSEYEVEVKDRVWEKIVKYGENNDQKEAIRYAHKDVLERGFTKEELKFLNAYRDRFLLIEILPVNDDSNRFENLFIWDNQEKKRYPAPEMTHGNFEAFHEKLKRFELI